MSEGCFVWAVPSLLRACTYLIIALKHVGRQLGIESGSRKSKVEEVQNVTRAENIQFKYLKYLVLYKKYRNSIQWTSGYTGLLRWTTPGFDTEKFCKALIL
jgi:hypothetical protein